jgi:hypothetical protein
VSTFTSEPGTRLGGRYRLEDRVAAAGGWAAWKAIDETLARPVTVLTFAPGFPQLREVVTAARAASRLNDSRFAQVFDVEDDWDHAYIVMEWAAGDTLDDMLAAGPIEAERGARIIAEAAEAMSAAHAAGLAHLCLGPDSLRWTAGGGVKITGLGIDAALSAATAEDPAHADTRRLGMLLYAALTGHWPGPDSPTLPPAPLADGLPRSPRQVRAGVPAALDEITSQVLVLRDHDAGPALTTPAQLSTALMAAVPPIPYWSPDGPHPQRRTRARAPGPGLALGASRVMVIALVVALVAAGLAFAVRRSLCGGSGSAPQNSLTHHPTAPRTGTAAVVITPVTSSVLGWELSIDLMGSVRRYGSLGDERLPAGGRRVCGSRSLVSSSCGV